ncbi:MAG: hypothetical protein ACXVXD_03535 [Nocardioidaceae bacterium]
MSDSFQAPDPEDVEPTPDQPTPDQPTANQSAPDQAATGHPVVDEVLASVDHLEGRPVDEHVAVFESAHERLRAALSDAGDDPA